jgi:hypothetical protein
VKEEWRLNRLLCSDHCLAKNPGETVPTQP